MSGSVLPLRATTTAADPRRDCARVTYRDPGSASGSLNASSSCGQAAPEAGLRRSPAVAPGEWSSRACPWRAHAAAPAPRRRRVARSRAEGSNVNACPKSPGSYGDHPATNHGIQPLAHPQTRAGWPRSWYSPGLEQPHNRQTRAAQRAGCRRRCCRAGRAAARPAHHDQQRLRTPERCRHQAPCPVGRHRR